MFVSVSASFILLQLGENWHTKCQGHRKRAPVPPTPPVLRVDFLHTEASGKSLIRGSVSIYDIFLSDWTGN